MDDNSKIYIVTKIQEHGDIIESDVLMAFKTYKSAIKYVNSKPDKTKYSISYDIDEIDIED